ncbi:MAG TPA: AI-2E family transporter [Armatimonadota bacterium]|nr:AI-2E family transporter [Armatimonadota bacterium]
MGLQLDPQRTRYALFTIALVAFVVILFLIAPLIWSVLQIFIIAVLIALALDVPVHWQVTHGVPRWAAVLNLIFILVILFLAIFIFIVPALINQSKDFTATIPTVWSQGGRQASALLHRYPAIERSLDLNQFFKNILIGAGSWAGAARSIFTTAFGAITAVILIIVTVFYTLLDPWPLLFGVRGLFPTAWWDTIDHIARDIAIRIRGWVIGTIILAVLIGILDYMALLLINIFHEPNVPFIFFFAILGGLLEVIPIIGPIIAAALPTLVAFSLDPLLGIMVLIAYLLVQQLENHLFTPIVMHKAVQMHPVSLIFMLVVLSGIFGLFGAIIAVPVGSVFKVLYDEWYYPLTHHGEHPQLPPQEQHGDDVNKEIAEKFQGPHKKNHP